MIFLPPRIFGFANNLGINRYTYTRKKFYNDTQVYVRLKTPEVLLQNMVGGKDSPLEKLKKAIEALLVNGDDKSFENYEYHLKMFCCIFKSAIREHISFISQKEHWDVKDLLEKYLMGLETITSGFRNLRSLLNFPSRNKNIFSIFLFGDEYLSLLIESYSYELLQVIKPLEFPEKDELTPRLFKLIRKELSYRKESFTFLKTDKIPDTIVKLRARDHITEIENDWVGEKIILYRKQVKLFNHRFRSVYHDYPSDCIVDIMRLNISRFLSKMDNPEKPIYVGDQTNCQMIYGNRVYHINMIMKYSESRQVRYKRFRLVLCQNGIKRIEEVAIETE